MTVLLSDVLCYRFKAHIFILQGNLVKNHDRGKLSIDSIFSSS